MNISIIGAGLGGLSAACLLAARGHEVSVFERNENAGGKMNERRSGPFRFDTGPSLLTMPYVLEDLFEQCGQSLSDYIELTELDPICKYFYPDGTLFVNHDDLDATLEEIRRFAPEDEQAFTDFLDYAARIYDKTADAFIFNPLYDLKDLFKINPAGFFGIDAFHTVSERIDQKFRSVYLRKFFKRFTTYNGSSPYKAPATLNVIPHVEINQGGYYVKGGLYSVATALQKLAESLGVQFHFNTAVQEILVDGGAASGLRFEDGSTLPADLILSNSDATETKVHLLSDAHLSPAKKEKASGIEPSCSGFVLLLGLDKQYEQLVHHNIFFSEDYEKEFDEIFEQKVMPEDPTIYIANTSYSDPEHAPEGGSNLFILVNAPYLSDAYDWEKEADSYAAHVISELEKRGLKDLSSHIQYQDHITPKDFYEKYLSNKGSIYGTSSNNKFSAFLRPRNKSASIDKLYYAGGSTHPGGGIPLVVQSAKNAVALIERYEKRP